MGRPQRDILRAIGGTTLLALRNVVPANGSRILLKLESENPTGSMKDRMALAMIEGAERRGELKPGGRLVEYTGGSTGSSLAMVCAVRGYRAHFVSSDGFAREKIRTMRAFGATMEIIPAEGGVLTAGVIDRMIARARSSPTSRTPSGPTRSTTRTTSWATTAWRARSSGS